MKSRRDFILSTALGVSAFALQSAFAKPSTGQPPIRFIFMTKSNGLRPRELALPGFSGEQKRADEKKEALKAGKGYSYTGVISESTTKAEPLKIIKWGIEKNIDLRKSLRIGMYSNYTYFYDMISNKVSGYKYNLKDELESKHLGKDETNQISLF